MVVCCWYHTPRHDFWFVNRWPYFVFHQFDMDSPWWQRLSGHGFGIHCKVFDIRSNNGIELANCHNIQSILYTEIARQPRKIHDHEPQLGNTVLVLSESLWWCIELCWGFKQPRWIYRFRENDPQCPAEPSLVLGRFLYQYLVGSPVVWRRPPDHQLPDLQEWHLGNPDPL